MSNIITISTTIHAPVEKVWQCWIAPADIQQWCHASDDWGVGAVSNDVRVGGKFSTIMAAKDGSVSFDFGGVYTVVEPYNRLEYTMGDGRTVSVVFEQEGDSVRVTEAFDMENQNSADKQRAGWQSILDNFKKHVEQ